MVPPGMDLFVTYGHRYGHPPANSLQNTTPSPQIRMFSTSSGRNNGNGQPYSTIRDYSDSESDVDDGEDDFIQREIRQQRVRFRTCIWTEE